MANQLRCLEPKMHEGVMLNGFFYKWFTVYCQATADTKPIEREIYDQSEIALCL